MALVTDHESRAFIRKDVSESSGSSEEDPTSSAEEYKIEPEPLPEGIFSCAISCFIRDVHYLHTHGMLDNACLKFSRLFLMPMLCFVCLGVQAFLMYCTKLLVTPVAVLEARTVYGRYETAMYTEDGVEWTTPNKYGFARGMDGHFNLANFANVNPDDRSAVCDIPLAQPWFFGALLSIWGITCLAELRKTIAVTLRVGCALPTIKDMRDGIEIIDKKSGEVEVVGCTLSIKIAITVLIQLPRLVMGCFLLFLGSRWLMATQSYADLLLNAVALEFILLLRETLYGSLVPFRIQTESQKTAFPPFLRTDHPTAANYFGMFLLLIVAILWSVAYMFYIQDVFPGYRWDVHHACESYLAGIRSGRKQ